MWEEVEKIKSAAEEKKSPENMTENTGEAMEEISAEAIYPVDSADDFDIRKEAQRKTDAAQAEIIRNILNDENISASPLRHGALGKQIGEGSHADIYEAGSPKKEGGDFVIKIGKTQEYSPPILNALKLSFPREKISRLLEKFLGPQFKIYPDMDFIKNGAAEQLLMKKYFGCDSRGKKTGKEAEDGSKNDVDESLANRQELFNDL